MAPNGVDFSFLSYHMLQLRWHASCHDSLQGRGISDCFADTGPTGVT